MAFLIFSQKGVEIGRRQVSGSVVIGRSPECDISVHDILLSRRHCRLQPAGGAWVVVDLESKNGTRVGGRRVTRQGLRDGDLIAVGKTTVRFQLGKVAGQPASPGKRGPVGRRPADPLEALAGTVEDFDAEADADAVREYQRRMNFPTPRPVPREPAAYVRDDVYSILSDIASSSWDSIYAGASRPTRPLPAVAGTVAVRHGPKVRRPARPERDSVARSDMRPARPARPEPVRPAARRGWLRATAHSVGRTLEAVRKWVAPNGAIRML